MAEKTEAKEIYDLDQHRPALEDFHDDYWTAPKLWVLGIITLSIAFTVILWAANTFTRPI